jgi:hypothetical protein
MIYLCAFDPFAGLDYKVVQQFYNHHTGRRDPVPLPLQPMNASNLRFAMLQRTPYELFSI